MQLAGLIKITYFWYEEVAHFLMCKLKYFMYFKMLKLEMRFLYSPRAWKAVILFFGSLVNIFLIRSLAESDIEGHGDLFKSRFPRNIASNMPFSVSKAKYIHSLIKPIYKT